VSFPRVLIATACAILLATTGTASASTHPYNGLPFAKTSFWNTQLPASPSIDPASATLVSDLVRQVGKYGTWVNTTSYSAPVYQPPAATKTVKVKLDNPNSVLQTQFNAVPIPSDAKPSGGTDGSMLVWQPSTDSLWEFWQARKLSDGWHAAWGGKTSGVSTASGVYPYPFGVAASGLSMLGGMLRSDELYSTGKISHPLAISVPEVTAGLFRAPATRTDGTISGGGIPEGTRFQLDPSFDVWGTPGIPYVTRLVMDAAKKYGLVVNDKGGAVSFMAEDPLSIGSNPWPSLFENKPYYSVFANFPWSKLRVVSPVSGAVSDATALLRAK
jgi:hypothetical protein